MGLGFLRDETLCRCGVSKASFFLQESGFLRLFERTDGKRVRQESFWRHPANVGSASLTDESISPPMFVRIADRGHGRTGR